MYSVRIIRRAMRDLSNLPQQYVDLLSQYIDSLSENPRPICKKASRENGLQLTCRSLSDYLRYR